jgi:hypothetical protein
MVYFCFIKLNIIIFINYNLYHLFNFQCLMIINFYFKYKYQFFINNPNLGFILGYLKIYSSTLFYYYY